MENIQEAQIQKTKNQDYKPSSRTISGIGYLSDSLYTKIEWRLVENKEITAFSLKH